VKLKLVQRAIKKMKNRSVDTHSSCELEKQHKMGLNSLLAKEKCKFGVNVEMNRKFHKICRGAVR
jgi:hypothetical protein